MNAGAGPVDARAALPVELTSFVGRRRELSELHTLLDRSRLVTITGAAGSGKTRLALERPEWIVREADRYRFGPAVVTSFDARLFEDVARSALRLAGTDASPDALPALRHAQALYEATAARDELNEELHRRLMSIWAGAGHRARTLRHYERLVGLLNDILDAEPEPETTELYDRSRSGAG